MGTRTVVLSLLLAVLVPSATASAAEVVASAPDVIQIPQGGLGGFPVEIRAEGVIGCGVSPSSPATARYDTVHSLVDGSVPAAASPADPLPFYGNNRLVLLPPLGCGVSWDGAPDPYRFFVSVAVASNVPQGTYTLELTAAVDNPGGALFAPLADEQPESVRVVVGPPVEADLPPPLEGRSINLLPVRGKVRVRYPGSSVSVPLTDPVQVPPNTGVNADEGFVTLLSDAVGTGVAQSTTLWNDGFKVDYTRVVNPARPRGKPAEAPITELSLRGGPKGCQGGPARAAGRNRIGAQPAKPAASARGKGLWAKGKGRFRTRGRYGAGTVRGTQWFTRETCEGTLFKVVSGVVTVSDLTIKRAFKVGGGGSYLVQPPNPGLGGTSGR